MLVTMVSTCNQINQNIKVMFAKLHQQCIGSTKVRKETLRPLDGKGVLN